MILIMMACSHHPSAITPSVARTDGPTAVLSWIAPTTNVDGTHVTDLKGYKLHIGNASRMYQHTIDVGNQTSFTLTDLKYGATYFFAVTCYDSDGSESDFSNEASKSFPAMPETKTPR